MARIPSSTIITTPDEHGFENLGGNYYFYNRASGMPPRYYQYLLSMAQKQIDIWDPFFTPDSARVFDGVTQNSITINILTKLQIVNSFNMQSVNEVNDFADEIKHVLKENGVVAQLCIQCFTKKQFPHLWHDRYLIIDEKDVYLIGTSLDDQINSLKDFGICRITNVKDIELIKNRMQECINAGIRAGQDRNCYIRH